MTAMSGSVWVSVMSVSPDSLGRCQAPGHTATTNTNIISSPAHQLTSSPALQLTLSTQNYIYIHILSLSLSLSLSLPSCWTNPKIVTEATCPLIDCLIMRAKPSPTLSVLSLSLTDIMSLFSVDVGSQPVLKGFLLINLLSGSIRDQINNIIRTQEKPIVSSLNKRNPVVSS